LKFFAFPKTPHFLKKYSHFYAYKFHNYTANYLHFQLLRFHQIITSFQRLALQPKPKKQRRTFTQSDREVLAQTVRAYSKDLFGKHLSNKQKQDTWRKIGEIYSAKSGQNSVMKIEQIKYTWTNIKSRVSTMNADPDKAKKMDHVSLGKGIRGKKI
jgi:hypothetical protein